MANVIGLDFGNCYSFPCFISEIDLSKGRIGGIVHDLLPNGRNDGIPSVFFYSNKVQLNQNSKPLPWCCEDAVRTAAKPQKNRVRTLKRHLGEKLVLDDRTFTYDEAITQVIQHCIRSANKVLKAGYLTETNLVSIAYPATYTNAQKTRLIELVEKATLENGEHLKVFGTIAEPAAAALDYLAEFAKSSAETTVLTYDLGGGTFDLGLVAAYPKGRQNASGHTYYYDIINTDGINDLGGTEFDEVMYQILLKKFGAVRKLSQGEKNILKTLSESTKIELSNNQEVYPEIYNADTGEYDEITVTRAEFEEAARPLLMRTIIKTQEMLKNHQNQRPEAILLTGGASQMPMVLNEMEKAFPEYRGKIIYYRPSRAIAYGATRYGTSEENSNPSTGSVIVQRTMYDLGIRFFEKDETEILYIDTYIKKGTEIPCQTEYRSSYTRSLQQRYSTFEVYEAKGDNPNKYKIDTDYTNIMAVKLDHGTPVPKGTESMTRLGIDALGRLTIEAYDVKNPNQKLKSSYTLKNLSSEKSSGG